VSHVVLKHRERELLYFMTSNEGPLIFVDLRLVASEDPLPAATAEALGATLLKHLKGELL